MNDEQIRLLAENLEPLNQKIVAVRDIEKANAQIFVDEKHRERFNSGTIVAMAGDCEQPLQVGQKVSWQKWGGVNLEMQLEDGTKVEFLSIHENELSMKIGQGAVIREKRKEVS